MNPRSEIRPIHLLSTEIVKEMVEDVGRGILLATIKETEGPTTYQDIWLRARKKAMALGERVKEARKL